MKILLIDDDKKGNNEFINLVNQMPRIRYVEVFNNSSLAIDYLYELEKNDLFPSILFLGESLGKASIESILNILEENFPSSGCRIVRISEKSKGLETVFKNTKIAADISKPYTHQNISNALFCCLIS